MNTKKIYAAPALIGRGSLTDRTLQIPEFSSKLEVNQVDLYERTTSL